MSVDDLLLNGVGVDNGFAVYIVLCYWFYVYTVTYCINTEKQRNTRICCPC